MILDQQFLTQTSSSLRDSQMLIFFTLHKGLKIIFLRNFSYIFFYIPQFYYWIRLWLVIDMNYNFIFYYYLKKKLENTILNDLEIFTIHRRSGCALLHKWGTDKKIGEIQILLHSPLNLLGWARVSVAVTVR